MRIKRTLATVAAAALATTGLVACSNESDDTADNAAGNNGDNVTVEIGTTEADQEAWRVFKNLAADNGIDAGHPDLADRIDPALSVGCGVNGVPDTRPAAPGCRHSAPAPGEGPVLQQPQRHRRGLRMRGRVRPCALGGGGDHQTCQSLRRGRGREPRRSLRACPQL